jgi:hypothetical protein
MSMGLKAGFMGWFSEGLWQHLHTGRAWNETELRLVFLLCLLSLYSSCYPQPVSLLFFSICI